MIRLPNLDDQNYADIVEAAKRRIPVIFPEWTDFNEHDPGITMLELFAWLKELQQYYLNRISDSSSENMLRLLGIEVFPPKPSSVPISFDNDNAPEHICKGCTAVTADGTVFASVCDFERAPFRIGSIFIENQDGFVDITDIAQENDTSFFPFGNRLSGDSFRLYIRLDNVDKERLFGGIPLYFDVADNCAVARNPVGDYGYIPRDITWEYSTAEGFSQCVVVSDDTCAFSYSGTILLGTGEDFAPYSIQGLPDGMWLRAGLSYCGCEDMPQLRSVYSDMMNMIQVRTDAVYYDFLLYGETVFAGGMTAAAGMCFVFVRDEHGWQYISEAEIQKKPDGAEIFLGEYARLAAADGMPDVRVVCCTEEFAGSAMFYSSDGLPCQQFEFDAGGMLLTDDFKIMVLDREDSPFPRWREYRYISSLGLADPYDLCFTYDEKRHRIIFGDNENGEAPPAGNENIMIVSCSSTLGVHGNMPPQSLTELSDGKRTYPVLQPSACTGGRDRESFGHAMDRLKTALSECTRAVTLEDYRTIAMRTPGLRIADAKAIPFFDPGSTTHTAYSRENMVSVVVLPYSTGSFPMPDKRFLDAVKDYIEGFRLITTRVKVIAPVYVKIDISAEIICGTREVSSALRYSEEALRSLLSVYGEDGRTRFGEPVSEPDIIARICSVDGVLSVKRLTISTGMPDCSRDRYGRLVIPPNAIAYCGEVSMKVTEP